MIRPWYNDKKLRLTNYLNKYKNKESRINFFTKNYLKLKLSKFLIRTIKIITKNF